MWKSLAGRWFVQANILKWGSVGYNSSKWLKAIISPLSNVRRVPLRLRASTTLLTLLGVLFDYKVESLVEL